MKFEVRTTDNFEKAAKPLLKKYKSLDNELQELESTLLANPTTGTLLGHNIYKVRIAIKSILYQKMSLFSFTTVLAETF